MPSDRGVLRDTVSLVTDGASGLGRGGLESHFPDAKPADRLAVLDPEERISAPPLVPVGRVTDEIVRLAVDLSSGDEVVVVDSSEPRRNV